MATKKPAAPASKPASKKPGTAVVPWEEQMAAAAQKQAAQNQPGGVFKSVSLKGGILSVDDEPLEDNELRCIIVVGVPENQHYDGPYNPNVPSVPICYAFGNLDADDPTEGMAPHEKSKEPQNATCEGCWANEMGSADVGRGKACGNVQRLLLITEDTLESPEALADAEARSLKVPVMSVNNFRKYVNKLRDDVSRPTWGVITRIKVVPDAKSQFRVLFSFEELINFDQDLFDAMQAKITELGREIIAPYPDLAEQEAPPARRGKPAPAPKGKPAAAKKPAGKPGAKQKF